MSQHKFTQHRCSQPIVIKICQSATGPGALFRYLLKNTKDLHGPRHGSQPHCECFYVSGEVRSSELNWVYFFLEQATEYTFTSKKYWFSCNFIPNIIERYKFWQTLAIFSVSIQSHFSAFILHFKLPQTCGNSRKNCTWRLPFTRKQNTNFRISRFMPVFHQITKLHVNQKNSKAITTSFWFFVRFN